jgi:hypothetical protein
MLAVSGAAADRGTGEHRIAKEPAYQGKPKYCLLVFGPEAKTRIWLVVDADARLLYVDRNGNGDLSEKDKRVEPYEKGIDLRRYRAGDIAAAGGKTKYTNLSVVHVGTEPGAQGLSVEEGFTISIEAQGKTQEAVVKTFGDQPRNAPVVHFDGPRTFALFDAPGQVFARGNEPNYLTVLIGTWGPDRKTFATIPCAGVPANVHPVAEIEFPSKKAGTKPLKAKILLDHRC